MPKQITMKLTLTPEEHDQLKREAASLHLTMTALVKMRVFGREGK